MCASIDWHTQITLSLAFHLRHVTSTSRGGGHMKQTSKHSANRLAYKSLSAYEFRSLSFLHRYRTQANEGARSRPCPMACLLAAADPGMSDVCLLRSREAGDLVGGDDRGVRAHFLDTYMYPSAGYDSRSTSRRVLSCASFRNADQTWQVSKARLEPIEAYTDLIKKRPTPRRQ
jgi:hypothetical protein